MRSFGQQELQPQGLAPTVQQFRQVIRSQHRGPCLKLGGGLPNNLHPPTPIPINKKGEINSIRRTQCHFSLSYFFHYLHRKLKEYAINVTPIIKQNLPLPCFSVSRPTRIEQPRLATPCIFGKSCTMRTIGNRLLMSN